MIARPRRTPRSSNDEPRGDKARQAQGGHQDIGRGVLQAGFSEHGFLVKLDATGKTLRHKDIDSPDWATVYGLAVDGTGAVTFTGIFRTSIGLGFSSAGDKDTYLARCDADGTLLWARQLGGDGFQMGLDVAVDPAGNSAVVGSFGGKIDLGRGDGRFLRACLAGS